MPPDHPSKCVLCMHIIHKPNNYYAANVASFPGSILNLVRSNGMRVPQRGESTRLSLRASPLFTCFLRACYDSSASHTVPM